MNALAATFRRRRPEADQLEDLPAEEGLQIIGQELVPVIPLTPSAEGGDAQSRAGGDQQLAILPGGEGPCRQGGEALAPGRPGGDQHLAVQLRGDGPCQYGGEVLAHGRPGGNDSELREGDRAQTMLVAVSPGMCRPESRMEVTCQRIMRRRVKAVPCVPKAWLEDLYLRHQCRLLTFEEKVSGLELPR